MVIHEEENRVSLSVGEFAQFQLGPRPQRGRKAGLWRMQLGQSWHQQIQREDEAANPDTSSEVVIRATWFEAGWHIHLHGRIDQLERTESASILREIKTVSHALPLPEGDIATRYPDYLCQLAAYVKLARLLPEYEGKPVAGELVLVEIEQGLRQVLPLTETHEAPFDTQMTSLCAFLNERRAAATRRRTLSYRPAFDQFRPEQEDAIAQLKAHSTRAGALVLEAPTGFGKTGLALEYGLQQLRDGLFERIVYLTGKSTGQSQVSRQLSRMTAQPDDLRHYVFRNRAEHAINSPAHTCDVLSSSCLDGIDAAWERSRITPWELWQERQPTLENIRLLGAAHGLCPYEISRSLLPYVDVLVGDYNYLFSPWHQQVFLESEGFCPERTLLIVDEAHNLASRVASLFSFSLTHHEARQLASELRYADITPRLLAALEDWSGLLESLREKESHDLAAEYEIADTLERLAGLIVRERIPWEELPPAAFESLSRLPRLHQIYADNTLDRLVWSPSRGELRVSCLDASTAIASSLSRFGQSLLMSATLSPLPDFLAEAGLGNATTACLRAEASWREGAYDVAVDASVDTRLRTRSSFYESTANTISQLCSADSRPTAVFFPSYRYAETLRTYLNEIDPGCVVAMQPRGIELQGQMHFIEESLLSAHAVFFVLGSSFSEGIDELGGRIGQAMVVGPALPEVNAEQKARMDRLSDKEKATAFRSVYQLPAMRKINQALGRLVRAPGQRARVLLHCRRFADKSYQDLLDPVLVPEAVLRSPADLGEWISRDGVSTMPGR